MWEHAWKVYGDSLSTILRQALVTYKRTAGLDDMNRLYSSMAAYPVLLILRKELIMRWPGGFFGDSDSCVELRSRLRSHLNQYLLRRIVHEHQAAPVLRDALFGLDLGI